MSSASDMHGHRFRQSVEIMPPSSIDTMRRLPWVSAALCSKSPMKSASTGRAAEEVPLVSIEPGRDDDQVGLKLCSGPRMQFVNIAKHLVGIAFPQGAFQILPTPVSDSAPVPNSGIWCVEP